MTDTDILVIGGGIHGAGVAQAAAAAGYSVLLLEQNEWGSGTSSKSSKLIHGGLRYLQSAQFQLVWECLRERERLLQLAPDLVKRNDFYIPVYSHSDYRSWHIYCALTLYTLLAGGRKGCRFSRLPRDQWSQLKGLKTAGLKQVFCYQDAQTDDRLLTRAVIKSAQTLGAVALCGSSIVKAERSSSGYAVVYKSGGEELSANCKILVNASGPWVNLINQLITPQPQSLAIDLVQGTHIVVKNELSSRCFYMESPDNHRAIFAMPWYGNTLVGTTETLYRGHPDDCQPLPEEEAYLLATLKYYFPDLNPKVVERFAGLRVLPSSKDKPFHRSRETQITFDQQVICIYGGKLTSYRATAEKVRRLIEKHLGRRDRVADTRNLPLRAPVIAAAAPSTNEQNAG